MTPKEFPYWMFEQKVAMVFDDLVLSPLLTMSWDGTGKRIEEFHNKDGSYKAKLRAIIDEFDSLVKQAINIKVKQLKKEKK